MFCFTKNILKAWFKTVQEHIGNMTATGNIELQFGYTCFNPCLTVTL